MQLRKAFLWSLIVSLAVDAVLGIAALVLPRFSGAEELLGTAALIAAFSVVALLCAIVLEKRQLRTYLAHLSWTGIGCAAAALATWLILLWFDRYLRGWDEETMIRAGGTFTILAIVIAQAGLLSLVRFHGRAAYWVRWSTVGISGLLAAYGITLVWWFDWIDDMIDEEFLFRGLGVLIILSLCGTVITPILWKIEAVRRAGSVESIPVKVRLELTCPRCQKRQVITSGPAKCAECGLRITVGVEEPRCVCGYLLYQLGSDRCPECGREITESDRWEKWGQSVNSD